MKTKDAIAIMNDEASTDDQLREVETFFKNAGLKGLLATVQGTLRRRTMPKPFSQPDWGHTGDVRMTELLLTERLLQNAAMFHIANNDPASLRTVASALLLAKCDRVVADYERKHNTTPGHMRMRALHDALESSHPDDNRIFDIPSPGTSGSFDCDCRPDEYNMCAARTCPNSCDWPEDEAFDYLPLDER